MQRIAASVLLAVVSYLLAVPTFVAGFSDIPECCRRLGRHHCVMLQSDSASSSTHSSTLRSAAQPCPLMPSAGVLPLHPAALVTDVARLIFGDAVRHPASHAQTDAAYRISLGRAHLKRGPPTLS